MPKGKYPVEYFADPHIDKRKSLSEIYDDIDGYTGEFFDDEPERLKTDFYVILPPLKYEGVFVKGLFMSQGVDYLYKISPNLRKLFYSAAYTMWSSFPCSKRADAYMTCYKNPYREKIYFEKHPEKRGKILLPLQDADFTNEYSFAPVPGIKKDVDLLYVARLGAVKNIPVFIDALRIFQKKYKHKLRVQMLLGISDDNNTASGKKILEDIKSKYGAITDYVEPISEAIPYHEMNKYYSRAKFTVLTSLIEGKNRTIHESMSCNTPVILFKDHNKWARGPHESIYNYAGLYVPEFSAESLADTIFNAFKIYGIFKPRKQYLTYNGRMNFLNRCIAAIPYYRFAIPNFVPGGIRDNLWLDLAVQDNYGLGLHDFLYGKNIPLQHVRFNENEHALIDFLYKMFGIAD